MKLTDRRDAYEREIPEAGGFPRAVTNQTTRAVSIKMDLE